MEKKLQNFFVCDILNLWFFVVVFFYPEIMTFRANMNEVYGKTIYVKVDNILVCHEWFLDDGADSNILLRREKIVYLTKSSLFGIFWLFNVIKCCLFQEIMKICNKRIDRSTVAEVFD